ncbi:hypothetical protein EMIT047CA2_60246 [Pseudomonas soli]
MAERDCVEAKRRNYDEWLCIRIREATAVPGEDLGGRSQAPSVEAREQLGD